MTRYTQGPWFIDESQASIIIRGRDQVVAKSHLGKGTVVRTEVCIATIAKCGIRPTDEKKANAVLVSAAPLMMEALENLENDDGSIPKHAWDMVQSAIKAGGGTPK